MDIPLGHAVLLYDNDDDDCNDEGDYGDDDDRDDDGDYNNDALVPPKQCRCLVAFPLSSTLGLLLTCCEAPDVSQTRFLADRASD